MRVVDKKLTVLTGVVSQCNLACPYCHTNAPFRDYTVKTADFEKYISVFAGIIKPGRFVFSGGEPLLHTDLPHLVSKAAHYLGYGTDIEISTNGILLSHLTPDGIKLLSTVQPEIVVSVKCNSYRDDFPQFIRGLKYLEKQHFAGKVFIRSWGWWRAWNFDFNILNPDVETEVRNTKEFPPPMSVPSMYDIKAKHHNCFDCGAWLYKDRLYYCYRASCFNDFKQGTTIPDQYSKHIDNPENYLELSRTLKPSQITKWLDTRFTYRPFCDTCYGLVDFERYGGFCKCNPQYKLQEFSDSPTQVPNVKELIAYFDWKRKSPSRVDDGENGQRYQRYYDACVSDT